MSFCPWESKTLPTRETSTGLVEFFPGLNGEMPTGLIRGAAQGVGGARMEGQRELYRHGQPLRRGAQSPSRGGGRS